MGCVQKHPSRGEKKNGQNSISVFFSFLVIICKYFEIGDKLIAIPYFLYLNIPYSFFLTLSPNISCLSYSQF